MKESKVLKDWGASLAVFCILGLAQGTARPCLAQPVSLVLIKISSYTEFREIQEEIRKIPGVDSVTSRSEARELITLEIGYSGPPNGMIESLQALFGGRYSITPKRLASGVLEIDLGPQG